MFWKNRKAVDNNVSFIVFRIFEGLQIFDYKTEHFFLICSSTEQKFVSALCSFKSDPNSLINQVNEKVDLSK